MKGGDRSGEKTSNFAVDPWRLGNVACSGSKMILGSVDFVKETALLPEMTLPEYMELVKAEVEKLPEGSIILTDVFGGTTTNVAAKLGRDFNLKCIPV